MNMYVYTFISGDKMYLQDSSPRLQHSHELQAAAGSRSSRYDNNLNTYMDSMAADSPDESVADDYAANNSYTNNVKSNSFNSSAHNSISKQLQPPPQEVVVKININTVFVFTVTIIVLAFLYGDLQPSGFVRRPAEASKYMYVCK